MADIRIDLPSGAYIVTEESGAITLVVPAKPPAFPFSEQEEYEALNRMKMLGGSFAKSIAAAWFAADLNNQRKLREAFTGLLQPYVDMYRNGQ